MKIDPKDLIPIPAGEFKVDGYFYRKEPDDTYSICCVYSLELKDPVRSRALRMATDYYLSKGLLFLNRNRPWARV